MAVGFENPVFPAFFSPVCPRGMRIMWLCSAVSPPRQASGCNRCSTAHPATVARPLRLGGPLPRRCAGGQLVATLPPTHLTPPLGWWVVTGGFPLLGLFGREIYSALWGGLTLPRFSTPEFNSPKIKQHLKMLEKYSEDPQNFDIRARHHLVCKFSKLEMKMLPFSFAVGVGRVFFRS